MSLLYFLIACKGSTFLGHKQTNYNFFNTKANKFAFFVLFLAQIRKSCAILERKWSIYAWWRWRKRVATAIHTRRNDTTLATFGNSRRCSRLLWILEASIFSTEVEEHITGGTFTQRQLEIYSIVEACHDYTLEVAKPGVKYADVHFAVCRLMFDKLKELGLAKGDTEEAVKAGAHAMFLPHGLGHMMGMDVHDMENLDQINVGFDEEVRPNLEQFGTNCLRMGRRLQEGFVVTDEPGIYFIPALIDDWKASGHCAEFLNFDKLETYKDFGGIRIEDDVLITKDGCRFIGKDRIPYHPKDVEEFMAANK